MVLICVRRLLVTVLLKRLGEVRKQAGCAVGMRCEIRLFWECSFQRLRESGVRSRSRLEKFPLHPLFRTDAGSCLESHKAQRKGIGHPISRLLEKFSSGTTGLNPCLFTTSKEGEVQTSVSVGFRLTWPFPCPVFR